MSVEGSSAAAVEAEKCIEQSETRATTVDRWDRYVNPGDVGKRRYGRGDYG